MCLAQNYAEYATSEQQQQQKAKAPLVDSTLLRFLSSQKKSGSVLLKDETVKESRLSSATIIDEAPLDEGVKEVEIDLSLVDKSEEILPSTADNSYISPTISLDKPIEGQSWLSQYNTQRVALKLQALGVDHETSIKAGETVQDYVLARITKRRIRRFLQERDALWESSSSEGGEYLDYRRGIIESMSPGAVSSFDIDSVITVMTEYGLTGSDVAAVFTHTPSVTMMRARTLQSDNDDDDDAVQQNTDGKRKSYALDKTLDRAFVGLLGETLKLRRYDARKVLRASPGLLTSKGSSSAVQVVNLMVSLGSSTNAIARDKASLQTLLCRSPALIFRLVAFLSSAQLKIPLSAIGPILRQRQSAELLNAVAPVKRALTLNDAKNDIASKNLTSSLNTELDMRGLLKGDNTLRQQKIEDSYRRMEAAAEILKMNAGIRDFRQILSSHPDALFRNVTNIHMMVHCLREDAGMSKGDVSKAIQTFPTLLEHDVSKVKEIIKFLQLIEVDEDDLPSILRSFPATLMLDVRTDMLPVVSFLRSMGVRNIGRFVTRLPPVLGYSVEHDLKPKWDFLREVCQFDYFEVVRFPAYFSYPLERVIKMRYEYLRDCKGIPIQLARVDDVLRFGDREFATEIALDNDGGAAFAKFVKEHSNHPVQQTRRKKQQRKRNPIDNK